MNKEWWQKIDPALHLALVEKRLIETAREVDFIIDHGKISAGSRIVDIACGNGRHALKLAEHGYKVVGLDYNYELLKLGHRAENLTHFVRGNILQLPFPPQCFDLALSMWNSIGYFKAEIDNDNVFHEISRIIAPGGRLILQLNNPYKFVLDMAVQGSINEQGKLYYHTIEDYGQGVIHKTISFDHNTSRYSSRRTISDDNGNEVALSEHDMRHYYLPEIKKLLNENQIIIEDIYGSVGEELYSADSNEIIIIAYKKHRKW